MTIGIDASRANNTQKTGVEWYAFFLIEELKKIVPGDVHVILYSEKPLVGELAKLPPNWSSKVLDWPPKRFWTQIRLSYEMLRFPPDILFIPVHVFPLIHPKKTVMTVHDVAALRFPTSYNRFERWYTLWSAQFAAQKLWKVIVPSKFTQSELEFLTGEKNKNVTLVHHGFDAKISDQKTEAEKEKILQKYNLRTPFFVTLGRLEEKKNTVRVIESFTAFKHLHEKNSKYTLVLLGKPGYGYDRVRQAKEKSPFCKDIFELGYVEAEDISAILQSGTALLFPSLYEGFGIPILEAFATQLPVITSKYSSTEEIAGEAALFVDPQNNYEIVDALLQITEDAALRTKLLAGASKRLPEFSWEKCAKETLCVLLNK